MKFNSFIFLPFFAAVVIVYYLIPRRDWQRTILICASLFFLSQANLLSLVIILMSAVLNYFLGIGIEVNKDRRLGGILFWVAILANVVNLFFFKYYSFFLQNLNVFTRSMNIKSLLPEIDLILPLGISFYTFQALGYVIDVRRENIPPERSFWSFLNYILFFPKLLAGPIERAQNFLSQETVEKTIRVADFSEGTKLLIWGFFQKLVIADRIAIYVNSIYKHVDRHSGITLLICSIFYFYQVYADFSGYTDIARGLARIFGYDLMLNFRRPLLASSLSDFWRRWHISLSSWVNDYIYMPLSLKFRSWGTLGVTLALFISFIVVGIWHGARWTFVIFGVMQGIYLLAELLASRQMKTHAAKPLAWFFHLSSTLITFAFVTVSLVFFRSPSLETAWNVLGNIGLDGKLFITPASYFLYSLFGILVLLVHDLAGEFLHKSIFRIRSRWVLVRCMPYALLVVAILAIGVFDGGQFIYFNF